MEEQSITEEANAAVPEWDISQRLRELSQSEIRLSKGLLRCDVSSWFSGLANHWLPLFHSLGAPFEWGGVKIELHEPEDIAHVWVFDVAGEPQTIGVSAATAQTLVSYVLGDSDNSVAPDVQDYLIRRLLTSFSESWSGPESLQCAVMRDADTPTSLAWATLDCSFGEHATPVHIGIGGRLADRIDAAWREHYIRERFVDSDTSDDDVHTVDIELAELAVPPAELIDYMRSGALIELDRPASPAVTIRVNGAAWATGELCIYGGKFAVQIGNETPSPAVLPEGTTRVQVILGSVQLDNQMLTEYEQSGAVLLSRSQAAARAQIVISGETVAEARIGDASGSFVLHVLPK